ncbi:MAG: hypothetical protein KF708_01110 [Pirellulales bacterium]|nr:hypothetical protein [Pirellulales bacterium]
MWPPTRWRGLFACAALLVALAARSASANDSIGVELQSGRHFTAEVDARTDRDQLWLSFGKANASLARPVDWDRVVRVTDATRSYTADEFLPIALERAAAQAEAEREARRDATAAVTSRAADVVPATYVASAEKQPVLPPQVAHLQVDAFVANWDGDVEPDGVMVYVTPVDRWGNYVPVHGNLVVELFGERPKTRPEGEKYPRLGRWSRRLTPDDFGPRGAVVQLKFQAIHPEFDPRITSYGLLHARLNVPGSGTFETSVSMLRIRPYSAYRDSLQMHRGKRYLPVERLGRQR